MKTKQLQLVTFEQAKRLKDWGFDLETMDLYHNDGNANVWIFKNHNAVSGLVSAPSVALALKWFRDEKGFDYRIQFNESGSASYCRNITRLHRQCTYACYEAAESALLDELLNILEENL